ncbi:hypothetical protein Tco_0501625 [Tanacetum coccineum]
MLGSVHHEFLLWGNCSQVAKSKYNTNLARLITKQIYLPCIVDWTVLNTLGCVETIKDMLEIKIVQMGGNEEIFTSEAYRCAFDISEPIYTELCHEFFATYDFDEEVTDEELISKNLIKFRLGGRGHSLSLLEFGHRLGLYTSAEIREEGFERTTGYDKIQRYKLWLMSMFEDRKRERYANVAWLISRWMKKKGVSSEREYDLLSLLVTTLRELIGPNGRLIAKDQTFGIPRVAMPRPSHPTLQDLSDRMGRTEIQQGVLDQMSRR